MCGNVVLLAAAVLRLPRYSELLRSTRMAQVRPQVVDGRANGHYIVYDPIASGGMATVHIGRFRSRFGFSRTVAVKRLHHQFSQQPEFLAMLLDEARLASRISHPNVVSTLDVVFEQDEVLLVMEYVHGETLATLLRAATARKFPVPAAVISSIICGTLRGLHAAHTARAENGSLLGIVHRDMSPQNVMVGVDGVARVFDFGIAKAAVRAQTTNEGQLKGKFAYMAPEQLLSEPVDARTDVFAVGVMLWECLTLRRLFSGNDIAETTGRLLHAPIRAPSAFAPNLPKQLDQVVMCALEREPHDRFHSAAEFADALEGAFRLARSVEVGRWVELVADESLSFRAKRLAEIESDHSDGEPSRPPAMMVAPSPAIKSAVTTRKPSRRRLLILSGVALGCLVGVIELATLRYPKAVAHRGAATRATVSFAATPEPTSPVALATEALAAPSSPSAEAAGAIATGAPRSTRRADVTKRRSASCKPPYRIDARGIRRVRPECL